MPHRLGLREQAEGNVVTPNPRTPWPNNRVETNRCQASRLWSWRVIGDGFRVCHDALAAAVALPSRSALLRACPSPSRWYSDYVTEAVAHILEEVEQLSVPERTELADYIVGNLAHDIPTDIAQAQITEVRRRIAQVEAGEAPLIPGEEALAQVRRLVASARGAN